MLHPRRAVGQASLPTSVLEAVAANGGAPVYLGYYWRGRHDVLWFKTDGVTVTEAGWWMALE